jgi:hypothetical protein
MTKANLKSLVCVWARGGEKFGEFVMSYPGDGPMQACWIDDKK